MARIDEIKERVAAATPGPWTAGSLDYGDELEYFKYDRNHKVYYGAFRVPQVDTLGNYECPAMERENADFIAHARADIPYLIERVERLEAALRIYANPENWDRVYAECRDEFITAWDVTASHDYRNEAWRIASEALESAE